MFTNMIIAKFRESRYLVRKGEVFIKDDGIDPRCVLILNLLYSAAVEMFKRNPQIFGSFHSPMRTPTSLLGVVV